MKKHILGFPRIGAERELKKALEAFWKGQLPLSQLEECAATLRLTHWRTQQEAGLDVVATGDFSYYDHMLDTCLMLGAIPKRFRHLDPNALETYFAMARGEQTQNIPAMEMTKWFNANYHYIVPEIEADFCPQWINKKIIKETQEAIKQGFCPKPVLVGPFTFLALAKGVDGVNCWDHLEAVVAVYCQVIQELAPLCEWIQIDEPILAADLPEAGRNAFLAVYRQLNIAAGDKKILLTTYFDQLDDHLELALASGCAGLHLDLVRGSENIDHVLSLFPKQMILSAGIVDGRNIWKNNFATSLAILQKIQAKLGDRIMIASSSSLLHTPVDLSLETELDPTIKNWMAFAVQKCSEVKILGDLLEGKDQAEALRENQQAHRNRANDPRLHCQKIADRIQSITEADYHRNSPYAQRKKAQTWLQLPLLPTTTIGSFPQTAEIRKVRRAHKLGQMSQEQYVAFMKQQIAFIVARQEEIGLDVLVHGEPERNDMVEYFGQQLNGFCFTKNGWVQSYGSRCVKPPVIFGDISRETPMTIAWSQYAQSLTKKPMKGMLTGPVTILCWSFVRDDLPRDQVCQQIALAILDEVKDLEQAGIKMIQIDEAALSEGMPIKERHRPIYLKWAVDSFRLATSSVEDSTQIHTHMCYSEFNTILQAIADMDADVISIESSRSKMEILEAFRHFNYPNEIGPGIYDIHSPRIPSKEEMVSLLERACEFIPKERLWVNPDCGLKTRSWEEVLPSLKNMMAATIEVREKLS